jgi:hypothetical protein
MASRAAPVNLVYKYWRIKVSGIKNKKRVSEQLEHIKNRLGRQRDYVFHNNPHRPPLYQLKLAIKNLTLQRQQPDDKRHQHLTFRQEVLVLEGKKDKATAIATIRRAEQRSRCFKKFQSITKPPRT